jgi:hypothetical protein
VGGLKPQKIVIDLDRFEITLIFSDPDSPFIAQFNTPNRKFFCSLVAFVVAEMNKDRQRKYINIETKKRIATLRDIDMFFLGGKASSDNIKRLEKCRQAWNYRLRDAEKALLFKVKERNKIKREHERATFKLKFNEGGIWCGLFRHYDDKSSLRFRFAAEDFGINLDDVAIIYNDSDEKAWERFIHDLSNKSKKKVIKTPSKESSSRVIRYLEEFCEKIRSNVSETYKRIYGLKNDLNDRAYNKFYIPVNITTKLEYRFEPESHSSIVLSEEEQRKTSFANLKLTP